MIEIAEHELPNGLRVVLAPDPATPIVAVNLWYLVGSRNEIPGRTGFAHLFEHMMFQGSRHIPRNAHFRHIEEVGGSANATTWFDRTNYFVTLPSHHLDLALWLESDRMGWMLPALTPETLENQRQVVMNERRERYDNQPYGDWDERLQAMLFPPSHPYHHTVIGSLADIEAATLDEVRNFFATWYLPNNAVLSLAGDFDSGYALERIHDWFGEIPRGPEPPPLPSDPQLPFTLGGTLREDVQSAVPLPRIYLASRVPPLTSEHFHAGEIASACLGAGRCSRLYDRLVRTRVAQSASCHLLPLTSGATIFVAIATALPETDPDELEAALLHEFDSATTMTGDEVERAMAQARTRMQRALQRVGTRADLLSMYTAFFDNPARLNDEIARLRAVTAAEAREWTANYLHDDNRAVLRYLPEAA